MDKQTWRGTRGKYAYFTSLTPTEVICYIRDIDDVEMQFDAPEGALRCDHRAFREGELQDWVIVHMGDEVLMELLTKIYAAADDTFSSERTFTNWQTLPNDLMLEDGAKHPDDDGYSRFMLASDMSTVAELESGATLKIANNSNIAQLTLADGSTKSLSIPNNVMFLLPHDRYFYLAGDRIMVIQENGRITYSSDREDHARLQLGDLFKTGNLYRKGDKIILEYSGNAEVVSTIFELVGRRGYFALDPNLGIVAWQASLN